MRLRSSAGRGDKHTGRHIHTPPKVALLGLARSAGKLVYSISKLPFPTSTQLRQCVFPPEELILDAEVVYWGRSPVQKQTYQRKDN